MADKQTVREGRRDRAPGIACPKCHSENCEKSHTTHTNFYPDGSEEHYNIGGGFLTCRDCGWRGLRPDVAAAFKIEEDAAWSRVGLSKPADFKDCIVCHGPAPKGDPDVVSLSVWLRAHKKCREAWRQGDIVPLHVAPVKLSLWARLWGWIRGLFR